MVLLGRVLGREERVLESAGREQASAEAAEKSQPLRFVEPWPSETGTRQPAQRAPVKLAATYVECTVHDDVEGESAASVRNSITLTPRSTPSPRVTRRTL